MDSAPQDGSILLTNEGCCYWCEEAKNWLLCLPQWRYGKPDHFAYSCIEDGAFDVHPTMWAKHPFEPLQ